MQQFVLTRSRFHIDLSAEICYINFNESGLIEVTHETIQRLINDDKNHRCVSYEDKITFDNYLRIDNSDIGPDEVAKLIKDAFAL